MIDLRVRMIDNDTPTIRSIFVAYSFFDENAFCMAVSALNGEERKLNRLIINNEKEESYAHV